MANLQNKAKYLRKKAKVTRKLKAKGRAAKLVFNTLSGSPDEPITVPNQQDIQVLDIDTYHTEKNQIVTDKSTFFMIDAQVELLLGMKIVDQKSAFNAADTIEYKITHVQPFRFDIDTIIFYFVTVER